jgi:predicted ester cyclase
VIACDGNERNLETYRKMHQVLFMERDGSRVAEFYAPRVLSHDLDSGGGAPHEMGHAQLAAMWAASRRNNPDRVLADDLIICQGPYVVVRTTVHGSDAAGVGGQPPTGRRYTISAIDIYRFEDSKVVERWGNVDMLGMLRQLGLELRARPTTGAAPADGRPGAPPPR